METIDLKIERPLENKTINLKLENSYANGPNDKIKKKKKIKDQSVT